MWASKWKKASGAGTSSTENHNLVGQRANIMYQLDYLDDSLRNWMMLIEKLSVINETHPALAATCPTYTGAACVYNSQSDLKWFFDDRVV